MPELFSKGPAGANDPRGRQAAFNAASADHWERFAPHRQKVSALLRAGAAPGGTRLCVLGAGNANDLDLPALLRAHREVTLVDLDAPALDRAAARQGVAGHPGLRLVGGVDLTGCLDLFAAWTPSSPVTPADLSALAGWPDRRVGRALAGPYSVVASTCLLSQLMGNAFHALGAAHPEFAAVVRAVRLGHLRLLTGLAGLGGEAVLVTDAASTDTLPALGTRPESSLPGILARPDLTRHLFHGASPPETLAAAREDPVLAERVAGQEALPPWRWSLHDRTYLVWALRYRMRRTR